MQVALEAPASGPASLESATAQAAMARAADADLATILWRRDVEEETVTIKVRGNLKEIGGKMGVLTKASGYEKGW